MELVINGNTYEFKAGFGFINRVNKKMSITQSGIKVDVGLSYLIGQLMVGDIFALKDALLAMNQDQKPKLTEVMLTEYLESEDTDIDALFEEVMDFFEKSNCTKKTVQNVKNETGNNNDK